MTVLLIVAASVVAYFFLGVRPMFRVLSEGDYRSLNGTEFAFILFFSIWLAICGPAVLMYETVSRISKHMNFDAAAAGRLIGGESRAQKIKRLEREARKRERKIASMERDLLES